MRLMEGILSILIVIFTISFASGVFKKGRAAKYIGAAALICFLFHWRKEGIRWQLYPIYLLASIAILGAILGFSKINILQKISSHRVFKILCSIFAVILIVLSAAASYAFPLYNLIKPKGEYKIGTVTFDAVDLQRDSIFSDDMYSNRKIRIQVWYPAEYVNDYDVAPWLDDGPVEAESIGRVIGVPEFLLSPIAMIKSNSYRGAPVSTAKTKYPIVIISHGLTGIRSLHTDLAEMLASHGYIAVSINHTYAAAVTVFENGELEYLNRNALPLDVKREEFLGYGNILLNTYMEDIRFTIDILTELNSNKNSILNEKFDLSAIGLIGHSAGGGAGVLTAMKDDRIKALIAFDPWLDPISIDTIKTGLNVPGLFLRSEQWKTDPNNKNLFPLLESSKGYRELYQIDGTTHLDFTMIYMYSPLSRLYGYSGKLDGWKNSTIRQDFVLAFLDKYLLQKPGSSEIEDIAGMYSEVQKVYK